MSFKLKIQKVNKVLLTLLFLVVFFTPEFKFLPHYTWVLSLFGFFVLIKKGVQRRICFMNRINKQFIILLFVSVIFLGLVVPIIHGTFDFTYLPILLGIVLCFFRNILLVYLLENNRYTKDKPIHSYIDLFLNACCICVIFTLLFIIFPGFKNFWLNSIIVNNVFEQHATWAAYEFRYSIGGFAAFAYATLFSFAVVMNGYLICSNEFSLKEIIRFGIICIGCIFYGRVSIIGIFLSICMIVTRGKDIKKILKFISVMVLAIVGLWMILIQLSNSDQRFVVWSNWAFSFIQDIFIRGKITTHSVENMINNMYFLPKFDVFLVGDGYYTDPITGRYYMGTDVGYMRMLVYSGITGTLVAFLPTIFMLYKVYKHSNNKDFRRFIISIALVWLVLEAKGESYHRVILLIYPLFISTLIEEKKRYELLSQRNNEHI